MSGTVSKRRPIRRVAAAGLALALFATVLVYAGCGQKVDPGGTSSVVPKPPDPNSKKVQIDPTDFQVDMGTVRLSKRNKETVQWHNQSEEPVLLLFSGAPTGEVIAKKEWSAVHHVCVACDSGAYEYRLHRNVNGEWDAVQPAGPTEPQVSVGD